MIAIAGPLSIAGKGLTAALYSRDQMIATYLAQESMEIIKNAKDNNVANSVSPWLKLTGFVLPADLSDCRLGSNQACDAGAVDGNMFNACSSSACPIYFNPATGGYSDTTGVGFQTTLFSRYFYLSQPSQPAIACNDAASECEVTVIVTWNEGTIQNQISITSEMANVIR